MRSRLLRKSAALLSLALIAVLLMPLRAAAWGNKGHAIVARIAFKLLSENARTEVNDLLAEGETLDSIATWADGLRGSFNAPGVRPETPQWHFVDIPLLKEYDAVRDCSETPNGSCAISAIVIFQDVLAKKRTGYYANSRYEALKFLVHFVGDIHQPLHCVDDNDFGGNTKKVVWIDGSSWKLHGIWDDAILSENMRVQSISSESAYADFLFNTLTTSDKAQAQASPGSTPSVVSRPTIEDWAKAAHLIANNAYSDIGPKDSHGRYQLGLPYYNNHKSQVDDQLKRAGIRLARILNENLK